MTTAPKRAAKAASAFAGQGLARTVAALAEEIRELYRADAVPWVVGYSGGKDSSAALQLVWLALRSGVWRRAGVAARADRESAAARAPVGSR